MASPRYYPGSDLLSHTVTSAVPSTLEGLTAVFGMGTGVTPPAAPPGIWPAKQRGNVFLTESEGRTSAPTWAFDQRPPDRPHLRLHTGSIKLLPEQGKPSSD